MATDGYLDLISEGGEHGCFDAFTITLSLRWCSRATCNT